MSSALKTTISLSKPVRMLLIGAPGVGKGTQTARLLARYPQISAISSGDLLRDNVRRGTELGKQADALISKGALMPDDIMLSLIRSELLLRNWLIESPSPSPSSPTSTSTSPTVTPNPTASFILDGFPRTAAQAAQLATFLPLNFVVHLSTPPDIILSRIANRWIHAPSGRVYNTTFNPPKVAGRDDVTGEALTQRKDDSLETWRRRLSAFEESSGRLLGWYKGQKDEGGRELVWKVEGETSDEISPRLFEEVERRFR